MGTADYDLALYESECNAMQTLADAQADKETQNYVELGRAGGKEVAAVLQELDEHAWDEFYSLLAKVLQDYPVEEARDQVYYAARCLRGFLAEQMGR